MTMEARLATLERRTARLTGLVGVLVAALVGALLCGAGGGPTKLGAVEVTRLTVKAPGGKQSSTLTASGLVTTNREGDTAIELVAREARDGFGPSNELEIHAPANGRRRDFALMYVSDEAPGIIMESAKGVLFFPELAPREK